MATRDLTLEQLLSKDRLPMIGDGERVTWNY
jgi:hypothetical protein